MTPEERDLWFKFLKPHSVKFISQKAIDSYIVDFYSPSARLIIEIDGDQHGYEENQASDKIRDKALQAYGFTVLRYTNIQINKNFREVCEDIERVIRERTDF